MLSKGSRALRRFSSGEVKTTPLFDYHVSIGGKMVPFAGYNMPVQYKGGLIKEHNAVRENAGWFDVSHMGQVRFYGKD